jgi:transposase
MLRVSLDQISNNHVRKTEFILYQREIIVKAHVIDIDLDRIHKLTNLPDFTIRITLKKVVERDDDEIKSRSGRSVILSERDKRHLIQIARINSRISYTDLKDQIDLTCSRTIIYRALKNYELVNWLTAKRLLLTFEMIRKRYEWCLIHKDWTYEHWSRMIFSDECSIEKESEKDRQWMFRLSHQKFEKKKIQSYLKDKEVSVMIWDSFWKTERSDLYKLFKDFEFKKKDYFANLYLTVLNDNLLEIWESDLIFMQDNALIHTVKKMKKWFNDNDIEVMNWSSYSSDLNLIEHLWFSLKKGVYQIRSDIDFVTDEEDTIRDKLFGALKET